MGGRGTFAAGNPVPYSYQTVDTIEGVKVLVGVGGKHGLPEEAHASSAYISLHHNGKVKQLRLYNSNLTVKVDIEYSVHQGKLSLHAHDYVGGVRQPARSLTEYEKKEFMKFFGGSQ
ncbi:MAG: hypothetical protein IJ042_08120 [Butyricicoccus sp.]|nr:hypothetical protein [Butyricicoccus sp.]